MSTAEPGKVGWRVTNQQRMTLPDANNKPSDGMRITYELVDGTVNHVFIPMSEYTLERAKATIAAHADTTAAVGTLTSES